MAETAVREVMEEALPQIQPNSPFKMLAGILEHSPAVLVTEKGRIKGIVSKSDLLKSVLDRKITKHSRLV
jgi:predicted transcriptional regulator